MIGYLRRLARTGSAYTASSVLAKLIALFTLPIYTKYISPSEFGQVEIIATTVIVLSILFRLGAIEALLRFYFLNDKYDPRQVVRTGFWGLTITTTAGVLICFALAGPLAALLLRDAPGADALVQIAIVWFWFATFYELLMALFRVEEKAGSYALASITNVLITVPLSLWFVIGQDMEAKGLVLGNAIGTSVVVTGLMILHFAAGRIPKPGLPLAGPMLRFGLPTVPGEISLYALNWVDRILLVNIPASRTAGLAAAGLYSIAYKLSQGVTIFVRAFQLAWPPLAYSIKSDAEAKVVYGRVLTYYLLITGGIVTALTLLAGPLVRLLTSQPDFYAAQRAVPYVATGVVFYGAYLVLVSAVARMGKTGSLFPVAFAGLVVNVILGLLLIPDHGIVGAGIALVGAYLVLLGLMYIRARQTLGLVLEWRRIVQIISIAALVAVVGDNLLDPTGTAAVIERILWWILYPLLLLVTGFFSRVELAQIRDVRALLKRARDSKSLGDRPDLVQEVHGPE
ncbi:MAG: oligosaccharide flippase family protein [Thermoleophilaceae bacterium]|nr:oligosaccharide flippase family protein [Thermoleophilaceae bacterium]